MTEQSGQRHIIPVWFFVGVILLIYDVLIFASGLYQLFEPPSTVLAYLHPALWWGPLLAVVGGIYVYFHRPRKS